MVAPVIRVQHIQAPALTASSSSLCPRSATNKVNCSLCVQCDRVYRQIKYTFATRRRKDQGKDGLMKSSPFWEVTQPRLVVIDVSGHPINPILRYAWPLNMGIDSSEMSVINYQSTLRNIRSTRVKHRTAWPLTEETIRWPETSSTINPRCVTYLKSEYRIYTTSGAWYLAHTDEVEKGLVIIGVRNGHPAARIAGGLHWERGCTSDCGAWEREEEREEQREEKKNNKKKWKKKIRKRRRIDFKKKRGRKRR